MHITRLAWLDVRRRPTAALLALVGVALVTGVGGVVLQTSAGLQARAAQADPDADCMLGPKSSALALYLGGVNLEAEPPRDLISEGSALQALRDDVRPHHVMPLARFAEAHRVDVPIPSADAAAARWPVVGVTDAWWTRPADLRAPTLAEGVAPAADDEVVLGAEAARALGQGPGDTVAAWAPWRDAEGAPVWRGELKVVGVLAPLGHAFDRAVVARRSAARPIYRAAFNAGRLPEAEGDGVSHILINLGADAGPVRERLFQIFHVRRVEQVVGVPETGARLAHWLGLSGGAGLALVALLALMGVGMVAGLLTERFDGLRPHLGVLRAQGYRRLDLAGLLWLQGLGLLVVGALAGRAVEVLAVGPVLRAAGVGPGLAPGLTAGHGLLWAALAAGVWLVSLVPLSGLLRRGHLRPG